MPATLREYLACEWGVPPVQVPERTKTLFLSLVVRRALALVIG